MGINYLLRGPGSAVLFIEGRYMRGLALNRGTALAPVSIGFRW
jgi:hypothetical protein